MAQEIPAAELVHNSEADQIDAPPQAQSVIAVVSKPVIVRYKVEGINIDGSNVTLSETFGRLASLLQRKLIKDYTLTRTNMEQVFIDFAKFQINHAAEGAGADAADPASASVLGASRNH